MSRKRILNVTSRKKKNTMLTMSNTTSTGTTTAVARQALRIAATTGGKLLWCPTNMDLTLSGTIGSVSEDATRTSTLCYMKGLAENIRIQTSSGLPWFWRRICFTSRDIDFQRLATADTPIQLVDPFIETSNGFQRLAFNQLINAMPGTVAAQENVIFKGTVNLDWDDAIIAPLDTGKISVKYDKTYRFTSGNANGQVKELKLWHGMNKNLLYADDESGGTKVTTYGSVTGNQGMGNYYVYDIIQAGTGATAGDLMEVRFNSTMYWHER